MVLHSFPKPRVLGQVGLWNRCVAKSPSAGQWTVSSNLKNREMKGLSNRGSFHKVLVWFQMEDLTLREGILKRKGLSLNLHIIIHFWWPVHSAEQGCHLLKGCMYQALHADWIQAWPRPREMLAGIWSGECTRISNAVKNPMIFLAWSMKEQHLILTRGPWTVTCQGEEISNSIVCWLNTP